MAVEDTESLRSHTVNMNVGAANRRVTHRSCPSAPVCHTDSADSDVLAESDVSFMSILDTFLERSRTSSPHHALSPMRITKSREDEPCERTSLHGLYFEDSARRSLHGLGTSVPRDLALDDNSLARAASARPQQRLVGLSRAEEYVDRVCSGNQPREVDSGCPETDSDYSLSKHAYTCNVQGAAGVEDCQQEPRHPQVYGSPITIDSSDSEDFFNLEDCELPTESRFAIFNEERESRAACVLGIESFEDTALLPAATSSSGLQKAQHVFGKSELGTQVRCGELRAPVDVSADSRVCTPVTKLTFDIRRKCVVCHANQLEKVMITWEAAGGEPGSLPDARNSDDNNFVEMHSEPSGIQPEHVSMTDNAAGRLASKEYKLKHDETLIPPVDDDISTNAVIALESRSPSPANTCPLPEVLQDANTQSPRPPAGVDEHRPDTFIPEDRSSRRLSPLTADTFAPSDVFKADNYFNVMESELRAKHLEYVSKIEKLAELLDSMDDELQHDDTSSAAFDDDICGKTTGIIVSESRSPSPADDACALPNVLQDADSQHARPARTAKGKPETFVRHERSPRRLPPTTADTCSLHDVSDGSYFNKVESQPVFLVKKAPAPHVSVEDESKCSEAAIFTVGDDIDKRTSSVVSESTSASTAGACARTDVSQDAASQDVRQARAADEYELRTSVCHRKSCGCSMPPNVDTCVLHGVCEDEDRFDKMESEFPPSHFEHVSGVDRAAETLVCVEDQLQRSEALSSAVEGATGKNISISHGTMLPGCTDACTLPDVFRQADSQDVKPSAASDEDKLEVVVRVTKSTRRSTQHTGDTCALPDISEEGHLFNRTEEELPPRHFEHVSVVDSAAEPLLCVENKLQCSQILSCAVEDDTDKKISITPESTSPSSTDLWALPDVIQDANSQSTGQAAAPDQDKLEIVVRQGKYPGRSTPPTADTCALPDICEEGHLFNGTESELSPSRFEHVSVVGRAAVPAVACAEGKLHCSEAFSSVVEDDTGKKRSSATPETRCPSSTDVRALPEVFQDGSLQGTRQAAAPDGHKLEIVASEGKSPGRSTPPTADACVLPGVCEDGDLFNETESDLMPSHLVNIHVGDRVAEALICVESKLQRSESLSSAVEGAIGKKISNSHETMLPGCADACTLPDVFRQADSQDVKPSAAPDEDKLEVVVRVTKSTRRSTQHTTDTCALPDICEEGHLFNRTEQELSTRHFEHVSVVDSAAEPLLCAENKLQCSQTLSCAVEDDADKKISSITPESTSPSSTDLCALPDVVQDANSQGTLQAAAPDQDKLEIVVRQGKYPGRSTPPTADTCALPDICEEGHLFNRTESELSPSRFEHVSVVGRAAAPAVACAEDKLHCSETFSSVVEDDIGKKRSSATPETMCPSSTDVCALPDLFRHGSSQGTGQAAASDEHKLEIVASQGKSPGRSTPPTADTCALPGVGEDGDLFNETGSDLLPRHFVNIHVGDRVAEALICVQRKLHRSESLSSAVEGDIGKEISTVVRESKSHCSADACVLPDVYWKDYSDAKPTAASDEGKLEVVVRQAKSPQRYTPPTSGKCALLDVCEVEHLSNSTESELSASHSEHVSVVGKGAEPPVSLEAELQCNEITSSAIEDVSKRKSSNTPESITLSSADARAPPDVFQDADSQVTGQATSPDKDKLEIIVRHAESSGRPTPPIEDTCAPLDGCENGHLLNETASELSAGHFENTSVVGKDAEPLVSVENELQCNGTLSSAVEDEVSKSKSSNATKFKSPPTADACALLDVFQGAGSHDAKPATAAGQAECPGRLTPSTLHTCALLDACEDTNLLNEIALFASNFGYVSEVDKLTEPLASVEDQLQSHTSLSSGVEDDSGNKTLSFTPESESPPAADACAQPDVFHDADVQDTEQAAAHDEAKLEIFVRQAESAGLSMPPSQDTCALFDICEDDNLFNEMESVLFSCHLEHVSDINEADIDEVADPLLYIEDILQYNETLNTDAEADICGKATAAIPQSRLSPTSDDTCGLPDAFEDADLQDDRPAKRTDKDLSKLLACEVKSPGHVTPLTPDACGRPCVSEDDYAPDRSAVVSDEDGPKKLACAAQSSICPSPRTTDACTLPHFSEDAPTQNVLPCAGTGGELTALVQETEHDIRAPNFTPQHSGPRPPTTSSSRESVNKLSANLKDKTDKIELLRAPSHCEYSICSSVTQRCSSLNSRYEELEEGEVMDSEYDIATPIHPPGFSCSLPMEGKHVDSVYSPANFRPVSRLSMAPLSEGEGVDSEDDSDLSCQQLSVKEANLIDDSGIVLPTSSTSQSAPTRSEAVGSKDELLTAPPSWNSPEYALSASDNAYPIAPFSQTDDLAPPSVGREEEGFLTECRALCDDIFAKIRHRALQSNQPQKGVPELPNASTVGDNTGLKERLRGLTANSLGAEICATLMKEDPAEERDNKHPEWEAVRQLSTDEERYQAVHRVWQNTNIPDPQRDITVFNYRRRLLRPKSPVVVRQVRNYRKRKVSSDSSSSDSSERARQDTDFSARHDRKRKASSDSSSSDSSKGTDVSAKHHRRRSASSDSSSSESSDSLRQDKDLSDKHHRNRKSSSDSSSSYSSEHSGTDTDQNCRMCKASTDSSSSDSSDHQRLDKKTSSKNNRKSRTSSEYSSSDSSKRSRTDAGVSTKHYRKRKASSDSSSSSYSAKRPRLDTDIFYSKIKNAKAVKETNMKKAEDMLRSDLDRIYDAMRRHAGKPRFYEDSNSLVREHRRAVPGHPPLKSDLWIREQRAREKFWIRERSIREAYWATMDKLVAAKDEIRHFNDFYSGLQDTDPRLLTNQQVKDHRKTEKILKYFQTFYRAAND